MKLSVVRGEGGLTFACHQRLIAVVRVVFLPFPQPSPLFATPTDDKH